MEEFDIDGSSSRAEEEGVTMRISAYNQVAQVYGKQSVKKSYNSGAIGITSAIDRVSLSATGRDMQVANAALSSVPDVREEKVQELKASIANGTYQVSAESFADKLMAAFDEKSI